MWLLGMTAGLGLLVAMVFTWVAVVLALLMGFSPWVVLVAFFVGYIVGMIWASRTKTDPVTPYDLAD